MRDSWTWTWGPLCNTARCSEGRFRALTDRIGFCEHDKTYMLWTRASWAWEDSGPPWASVVEDCVGHEELVELSTAVGITPFMRKLCRQRAMDGWGRWQLGASVAGRAHYLLMLELELDLL